MSNSSLKRKFDSSDVINSLPNRSQFLNEKLSHRPDRHQLVSQGILHDSQCAPSLQHAERALKRARLADQLNNRLVNRPGPLDLIQHNILHIDTNEHPNLEEAIQGGQIPFKTTSTTRRPLIFHEYTGSPSTCKPKVTKIESLSSSSNTHQIRLAQQQLLLQLTSNKQNEEQSFISSTNKSLEQMTRIELRDICKQYQIPSSNINKTKLIQRIKQTQYQRNNIEQLTNPSEFLISETNSDGLTNGQMILSLKMNEEEEEEIEPFSISELDEILKSFPMNLINLEEDQIFDFDIDSQSMLNDDLFVEMLLDNDYSLPTTTTTSDDQHLFYSTNSSALPRITTIDEFDAFLTDFTRNFSSHQQEVSTPIS